jgi:exopolyphosphatase/guanosine-5'-triphosphate,3'-diphosphate pyrophosphatase
MLFEGLQPLHRLPPAYGKPLEAAGYLYNIGHYVNEQRHHRHSLYLVLNSDLPGFSDRERMIIANLCRYHRKSSPQPSHDSFQALEADDRKAVTVLTPLLRLAVALDQSQEQRVDSLETLLQERTVEIRVHSTRDVDNEQWHATRVGPLFREIYNRSLTVLAKR